MAPPKINDDKTLLEISICCLRHPSESFASWFREAMDKAPAQVHSEESARRRLQRKFERNRQDWIACGELEIRTRREKRLQEISLEMGEGMERLATIFQRYVEQLQPALEGLQRVAVQMRPVLETAHQKFNSPEMQRTIKNMERLNRRLVLRVG